MKLNSHAREKTDLFQRRALVGQAEIYVHRWDLVICGDLGQRLAQQTDERRAILARGDEKALPGHRGEGNTDEHLGIVLNSRAMRRLGPFVIEDEFPHAIEFQVHGTGRQKLARFFSNEVMRQPTRLFADGARLLEAVEPIPFRERRGRAR